MFPNPVRAGEPVYFSNIPISTKLTILNHSGKEIFKDEIKTHRYRMETFGFVYGIYFIKMTSQKEVTTFKLMIN